jgi:hypothetical protein
MILIPLENNTIKYVFYKLHDKEKRKKKKNGMAAHGCNLSYRRITVQGQPGQKVSKTPSQKSKLGVWHTYPSYAGDIDRRMEV